MTPTPDIKGLIAESRTMLASFSLYSHRQHKEQLEVVTEALEAAERTIAEMQVDHAEAFAGKVVMSQEAFTALEAAEQRAGVGEWLPISEAPDTPYLKGLGYCHPPSGPEVRYIQRNHAGQWIGHGVSQKVSHFMPLPLPPEGGR